jgi:nitric oxide reductase subunit C
MSLRMPAIVTLVAVAMSSLTWFGFRDMPQEKDSAPWNPRAVAGQDIASSSRCTGCHSTGGAGPDLTSGRISRDDEWIASHLTDPGMIAPGASLPASAGLKALEAQAVLAYVEKIRQGARPPRLSPEDRIAANVFATRCVSCHTLNGDGGTEGPDLTHEGQKHDAAWLAAWITDPSAVDPIADMPSFGGRITGAELTAISNYLAARK